VPAFVAGVREARTEPPGFGHRVYRTYDPRARILREHAAEVFAVTGRPRVFETALSLERAAARMPTSSSARSTRAVDFYETIIYHAIGLPRGDVPVLFAIPRFIGWAAQWEEMMRDPSSGRTAPRQIYVGPGRVRMWRSTGVAEGRRIAALVVRHGE